MRTEAPKLDNRNFSEIYRQAIRAARVYCPEWINTPANPADLDADYFDPEDTGLVLLKLLSRMTESTLAQLNRVPDKHKLAFFDLLGIDLLSARASNVPLTFSLSKGAANGFVKKGSRIASKSDETVVFETQDDLSVLPVEITQALSFDPWRDRYTIHKDIMSKSEKGHRLFGYDKNENKCPHRLFLRSDLLFNVKEETNLEIKFEFPSNVDAFQFANLFNTWKHEGKLESEPNQESSTNNILSNKISLSACEDSELEDTEHWISVGPASSIEMADWHDKIPQINSVKLTYSSNEVSPDLLFSDNVPLEAEKGFYPFQKTPEARMSFYIGSLNLFQKENADITIKVTCDTITLTATDPAPVLDWQYWDGKSWQTLHVTDGTDQFRKQGNISFLAPKIEIAKVNGKKNRWIRATIKSGGYGQAGSYKKDSTKTPAEYIFIPATYNPAYIKEIKGSYAYNDIKPQEARIENYFHSKPVTLPGAFTPYELKTHEYPSFYFAVNKAFHSQPLSFFFLLEKRMAGESWSKLQKPGAMPENTLNSALEWQYYNGQKWSKIENVNDGTSLLNDQGIVNFIMPPDAAPTKVFENSETWIRLASTSGNLLTGPRIQGIFPNTVNTLNQVELKEEILGSSNAKPDQQVSLSRTPVLDGQIIEIIESQELTQDELQELEKEEGPNAITEFTDEMGIVSGISVRWSQVGDFTLSGPKNRHYTIKRDTGLITFGNGKNGLIPPTGRNNIIARHYKSGGGRNGNLTANSITSLKTAIPNVESATNWSDSYGGMDPEILSDLIDRAPHTVKTKDRAVTAEDYEWLAKEADPMVVRSRCNRNANGKLQIIILPQSEESSGQPTTQMLKTIQEYLVERSLFTLKGDIEVLGPVYKIIDIRTIFKPVNVSESMAVQEQVILEIKSFFHSITGNVDKKGWDFGEGVYSSDLSAKLESIQGVDYIKEITLSYLAEDDPHHVSIHGIGNIGTEENEIVSYGKVEAVAEG